MDHAEPTDAVEGIVFELERLGVHHLEVHAVGKALGLRLLLGVLDRDRREVDGSDLHP